MKKLIFIHGAKILSDLIWLIYCGLLSSWTDARSLWLDTMEPISICQGHNADVKKYFETVGFLYWRLLAKCKFNIVWTKFEWISEQQQSVLQSHEDTSITFSGSSRGTWQWVDTAYLTLLSTIVTSEWSLLTNTSQQEFDPVHTMHN